VYLYSKKYSAESLFVKPQLSQFEIEVRAFVQSITSEFVCSDRSVLLGKELDIYIPQKQLAIECSGLYWHSEIAGQRTKEYHTNKYQQCTKLGINLITIWEDQWNFKKDQCKQRLTYLLKASQSTVSARKCTVEWMTPEASADFFDQHHIQGFKYQSTQTGYWYTDYKQRLNRMQFQRKQIAPLVENSENLTEWQIMQQLKYDRIWDCGQSTWIWHK
jgi:G:T-mismatch repair DNA endonuclease (very short patch repair protein)